MSTPQAATAPQPSTNGLTREILKLAGVVVLGAIMTVLDATIVNVAIPTLGKDFHTSIATIQWVPTVYLLTFAAVIPLTGWLEERFGTKQLWVTSLTVFTVGSLLAGLSWSIGSLIAFRVVQGVGGGVIMPIGQTILGRAAGPHRMGRVMSIIGVPLLLAPIFGPIIGGALVSGASWRWVFYVNLPVSAAAIVTALRVLPRSAPSRAQRLDWPSVILLPGGLAIALYGLAEIGQRSTVADVVPLTALVVGSGMVAGFVVRALRMANPLIDVRLFAWRGFATSAVTNFVLGVALFGVALLLPLYFQLVRGQTPLQTGLLLIPQGVGAACAIGPAGMLTDKIGARKIVPAGVVLALAGAAGYTQVQADTSYWALSVWLFLIGAGLGATISPSMAAAYQGLQGPAIGKATSAINVVQRVAGSLGSALLAVILQRRIAAQLPGFRGGVAQAATAVEHDPAQVSPGLAHAFGATFWVALALAAVAIIPALLIPPKPRRGTGDPGSTSTDIVPHHVAGGAHLRSPWMQRHVGNRMSVLFRPSLMVQLTMRGRTSGNARTIPIVVLEHAGERYLVSYRGESESVRNLRISRTARLTRRTSSEVVHVEEVPLEDRSPLLEAYHRRYGGIPTVGSVLRRLPDPADHPVFRITDSTTTRDASKG